MLKYWLSVPLIGITLILVACSESPNSSAGVLMKSDGGLVTIKLEQAGGHGAIEVYLIGLKGVGLDFHGGLFSIFERRAVAEGQCTGPATCRTQLRVAPGELAGGIRVVWTAKDLPDREFSVASAYTLSLIHI